MNTIEIVRPNNVTKIILSIAALVLLAPIAAGPEAQDGRVL